MQRDDMMLDFTNKTYRALLDAMLARVPNSLDKREGSMIQTALGAGAYSLEDFYLDLDKVQRGGAIQTSVGEDLDNLAVLANVERYPASPAVRLGVFNLDSIPIGARFSTIDGGDSVNFTATSQVGPGQYRLTCETPGVTGNSYTGPILPITVIPGLTSAQITDILVPGDDREGEEALRERVISALRERPFGGNVADYKRVVLAIDGVGAVQVYPTWDGGGTVKLSVMGADWMPASAQLVETVQTAVDPPPNQGLGYGTAPIGARVTVTAPETAEVDVSAVLTLRAGYTVEQMQPLVEAAVGEYLLGVRKQWAEPDADRLTSYSCWVYLARVVSAILQVPGVVNATGVTLNGGTVDLQLVETGLVQQVPVPGEVALRA